MKEEKQLFWDSYSSRFNSIYGTKNNLINNIINKLFRQSMKLRFNRTIENIPGTASSVLDIGCGPGHFCIGLSQKKIPHILGIDFSKEMIDLAKVNAEINNASGIDFRVWDFLKFAGDRKYEYSIMMGFIEYFEDPLSILNKAIENTQNQIFVSFPKAGGFMAFQRKLRYKKRCFLKLYTRKDLTDLFSNLKIASYKIEDVSRDYYVTLTI
jgi:2-polyprenyl-3-methyl-5-hydroxy-6-metoxy-1,4-benzoquinol methylase